jgi:hypothetical protein
MDFTGESSSWFSRRAEYRKNVNGIESSKDKGPSSEGATRMFDAAAIKTHLTLLVGLTLCGLAFWFEMGRALGGNSLSWAYVFEWPLLGIFAVYMWWKLLHPGFTLRRRHEKPAIAPEYEGMLAAWQEEQRRLEDARQSEESESPRPFDGKNESSRSGE